MANVQVDGGPIAAPSLNTFAATGTVLGEPSVQAALDKDLYLTLVEPLGRDGKATIGVVIEPLVVVAVDRRGGHGVRHAAGGVPRPPPQPAATRVRACSRQSPVEPSRTREPVTLG